MLFPKGPLPSPVPSRTGLRADLDGPKQDSVLGSQELALGEAWLTPLWVGVPRAGRGHPRPDELRRLFPRFPSRAPHSHQSVTFPSRGSCVRGHVLAVGKSCPADVLGGSVVTVRSASLQLTACLLCSRHCRGASSTGFLTATPQTSLDWPQGVGSALRGVPWRPETRVKSKAFSRPDRRERSVVWLHALLPPCPWAG